MPRTRARSKGRRGGEAEHFARIPVSVLESEACTTLHHAAFKVLVILASQYRGRNNGALALTELYARRFGLHGRNTLYRSLSKLEQRGLIVRTRKGFKSKTSFSLYALGWEPITHRDGQLLDTPEPCNNSTWLNWRASLPTMGNDGALIGAVNTAGIHTHHGESPLPTMGNDDPVCVPMVSVRRPLSLPTMGNTLRSTPGTGDTRERKACELMLTLPHLTDHDIARMTKIDPMRVAQLRISQAGQ